MELARSTIEFVKGIIRRGYLLLPGIVGGGLDVYERTSGETVDVAPWLIWTLIGGSVFVAAAWSFHDLRMERVRLEREERERVESLPSQIDALFREGIALIEELSVPVEPEQTGESTWSLSFTAPNEWWEKAETFDQRVRDLFTAEYPVLLSDYANGINEQRRKRREWEAANEPDPHEDKRPNAIKLREFADRAHGGPARAVEASLEGLAAARHRARVG